MNKLENKVAVVTGGNSGIGLATAKLYKEQGATVIINARNAERLAQTKAELGNEFEILQADVQQISELENFYNQIGEKYGKIDVLFLNAGIANFIPLDLTDEASYDRMMDTNVKGVFFGIQKALPHLAEGASILLTTSVANQKGMAAASVYSATKAAVRSLARTLSTELLPRGIRVNAISPGPIETPIFDKLGMTQEQLDQFASSTAQQIPMGRFGQPEEVAKTALFLATEDSSYIVGAEIEVDGGMANI